MSNPEDADGEGDVEKRNRRRINRKANAEPMPTRRELQSRRGRWFYRREVDREIQKATDGGEAEDDGRSRWADQLNPRFNEVDQPSGRNERDDQPSPEARARLEAAEAGAEAIENSPDYTPPASKANSPIFEDGELQEYQRRAEESVGEKLDRLTKALRDVQPDGSKRDELGDAARGRSDERLRERFSRLLSESGGEQGTGMELTLANLDAGRFDEVADLIANHFGIGPDRARAVLAATSLSKDLGGEDADEGELQAVLEAVAEHFDVSIERVAEALEQLGEGAREAAEQAEAGEQIDGPWPQIVEALAD